MKRFRDYRKFLQCKFTLPNLLGPAAKGCKGPITIKSGDDETYIISFAVCFWCKTMYGMAKVLVVLTANSCIRQIWCWNYSSKGKCWIVGWRKSCHGLPMSGFVLSKLLLLRHIGGEGSYICLFTTRSLGARRAPTSSWRPFGPLDFVLHALRALRPWDPRVSDWIAFG